MLRTLRNNKAVTLVELLAVIVILAIIAAISVPTIGNMIDRQRANAAAASGNAVVEALRLYATENPTVVADYTTTVGLEAVIAEFITAVPDVTNITFSVNAGVVSVAVTDPLDPMIIDTYEVIITGGVFERNPA